MTARNHFVTMVSQQKHQYLYCTPTHVAEIGRLPARRFSSGFKKNTLHLLFEEKRNMVDVVEIGQLLQVLWPGQPILLERAPEIWSQVSALIRIKNQLDGRITYNIVGVR